MINKIKTIVTGFFLLIAIFQVQSQDAIFTLEDEVAGVGSSFCMNVNAENLMNINALQFSINWDQTILELTSIDALNSNFAGANINTAGSASGVSTFSFSSAAPGGVSMPNGDLFFRMCFTVVGAGGSSTQVDFTGTPTSIDILALINGVFTPMNLVTQGGNVTVPTPLIFTMPNEIYAPGASFCLPVSVTNFDDLESIQSAINWDASVLQYDSVSGFGLPDSLSDLDINSFGVSNANSGTIGFSWNDDDPDAFNGVTLVDGTIIFEICFTVIGSVNDMTCIIFDDNPIPIEVVQFGNSNNLGLQSEGGKINIQQTIFITNSTLTQPNCIDPDGGGINISIAGGNGPYTYLWSNDSTTQDLTGLGVGSYTVTITDSNIPANVFSSNFSLLGNLVAPMAETEALDTISCAEPTTVLDGTGSSTGTDIIYEWIHDAGTATILSGNTIMATVNAVGFYSLIVTDTLSGCSSTASTFVTSDAAVPPLVDAGEPDTLNCGMMELELDGDVDPSGNYTYAWTTIGGQFVTDQDIPNPTINQAGIYILTVTADGTGCMATDTVEVAINEDTPLASATLGSDITCTNSEVTLDGSASSSGSLITYSWSGIGTITGGTTTMPSVNAVGIYTLIVTNTYSECTAEAVVVVGANLAEPTAVVSDINDEINCTTPSIMLDGTGSSTGDFTYLWTTNGGDIASEEMTLMPTVTAGGEYILTVTDTINGCTASDTTMIDQDANLPIANAGPDRTLTCEILSLQLDGSDSSLGAEFKYLWTSTVPGSITTDPTSIAPIVNAGGVYTLQVLDSITNCTATSSMTVLMDTLAPIPNPVASGILTCSLPQILLSQGTALGSNITEGWDVIAGTIAGATIEGDLIIDAAGTFQLTLTNIDNGCKDSASIVVMQNDIEPIADAGDDFELDCGQTTATLDGSSSSTGTNYIYQWTALSGNPPGNPTILTPSISSAGEYLIMITDTINGCMHMDTVVVTESDDYPIVEAGANGAITCTNPEITLDASLVSSSGPDYFIEWVAAGGSGVVIDGNENTLMPTINEPGPYILTITNINNNCSATDQLFVFSNNTPPTAIVVQDTLEFECEPLVILDGTGSTTAGVEYLWKTTDGNIITGQDTLIAEANLGGTYTLCITNMDNGCTDTATVFVGEKYPEPDIIVDINSNITCSNPIVTLDGSGSILLPNQIFDWITGPNGNYIPGTTDGFMPMVNAQAFYTLRVTDTITGCVFLGGALVLVDSSLVMASAMADGNIDCVNNLVNLEASVNASTMDVIYNWTASMGGNITSLDPTQLIIEGNAAGIYEFVALDTLTGCTDTVNVEVLSDMDAPIADAGMETELSCTATSVFLDGSGSSMGDDFTYLWETVNGSIVTGTETDLNPEVETIGTYILTVKDTTNGCIDTAQVEVVSNEFVTATAATPVNLDCGVISILLDGTGSTTGATITYLWTPSNGGVIDMDEDMLMPQISSPGTYTLLVTDTQTGCTATSDVEVLFNNPFALADAGSDLAVCETITNLEGNLPTDVTGIWLSLGNGIPTDPASPTTEVTNLATGANVFVWTLSALGCPEYSSDTVVVTVDEISITNDDTYTMEENEVLDFDVSINDMVGVGQFIDLTSVANGTLNNLGGGGFNYTPNLDFIGTEIFEYEFCSDICLDVCDTSLVTITINVKDPLPVDSLLLQNTNTITPNDDGLNDVFVFDILVQNPNDYVNNEFVVFNRWGDVVYEAKPYNNDWGGTNQSGKPLPEGTYYYILRLDLAAGIIMKGGVTILR